ncbi:hypothetical protein PR202_ga08690 [Eleusine coracana subsp. coracana]|uniref:Uncharacterized protein n=1 Tax=Eleusine coracana subsp. coracana TaxID=191504 RepID=A0AAV5C2X3_ELECO|nr:hypothetical protein PR202_ga08690 [Eleusine coracana subsp. coracana]
MPVIEFHQDEVWELPPKAEVLARSDKTGVEMFRLGDRAMGVQGHPEYSKDILMSIADRLLQNNLILDCQVDVAKASFDVRQPDKDLWKKVCRGFLKGRLPSQQQSQQQNKQQKLAPSRLTEGVGEILRWRSEQTEAGEWPTDPDRQPSGRKDVSTVTGDGRDPRVAYRIQPALSASAPREIHSLRISGHHARAIILILPRPRRVGICPVNVVCQCQQRAGGDRDG